LTPQTAGALAYGTSCPACCRQGAQPSERSG